MVVRQNVRFPWKNALRKEVSGARNQSGSEYRCGEKDQCGAKDQSGTKDQCGVEDQSSGTKDPSCANDQSGTEYQRFNVEKEDQLFTFSINLKNKSPTLVQKMEYKPLNHFRSEIRLVTIIPGEGSRIECTIKVVSLTLPPEYTALSYCWGNPKVTRDIYIGDHVLTVTTNLYAALMHLRLKDKPVTLWVDSICINQADISERNRQVSLMGVIYRKAKMTIAWLGESDDESHQCFDILEFLAWGLQDQAGNQFYHRLQLKNLKFQKLVKLFSRCYWIRSWIIQEVCLSQDVELVCGNRRLNWNVFSQALEYIQRDPELFTPEFRFPSSYYEHITMLKACREDMTGDVPLHFVDAVSRCRQSIATDPRDKVFSLLGLAYNGTAFIPVVDYGQSTSDLNLELTVTATDLTRSLDIIVFLAGWAKETRRSWMPNWLGNYWGSSDYRKINYLRKRSSFLMPKIPSSLDPRKGKRPISYGECSELTYKAQWTATLDHRMRFDVIDNVLRVFGVQAGIIASVTSATAETPDLSSENYTGVSFQYARPWTAWPHSRSLWYLLFGIKNTTNFLRMNTREDQVSFVALWSSLTDPNIMRWLSSNYTFQIDGIELGQYLVPIHPEHPLENYNINRQKKPIYLGIRETIERKVINIRNRAAYEEWCEMIRDIFGWGMRLAVTQQGDLGWVDSEARPGDVIWLLKGCSVPVVLRPLPGGGWSLIGDSIMDGYMQGEGLRGGKVIQWKSLHIH